MIGVGTKLSGDASKSTTILSDLEVRFAGKTARYKQVSFEKVTQGNEVRISGTIASALTDFKCTT
jgi:hypothetical protein